jgi:dihydrofolate reductase
MYEDIFKRHVDMIVAVDSKGGIGNNGTIPWVNEDFCKKDLEIFQRKTKGSQVIMGRKTADEIKDMSKGDFLPGRHSIVVTKNGFDAKGNVSVVPSLRAAMELAIKSKEQIIIIGGESIYRQAAAYNIRTVHMTVIDNVYPCDSFFPMSIIKKMKIFGGEKINEYVYSVSYTSANFKPV